MKLFGYWWKDTTNQHLLSYDQDDSHIIAVPQDRCISYKKLAYPLDRQTKERQPEHPRRVVFEVEGWLEAKPEYQKFREAKPDDV